MEIFKTADYVAKANPEPGQRHSQMLLEQKAKNLTGIFAILPAGGQTPYHFHKQRESVIFVISGRATEVVEGEKRPISKDDVIFIPAGQKHAMVNDSGQEIRYIEFQTGDPEVADFVDAGEL